MMSDLGMFAIAAAGAFRLKLNLLETALRMVSIQLTLR